MSFDYNEQDLATAGLRPEGWYYFDLKSKKKDTVPAGVSQKTGEAYDAFEVLNLNLLASEQAVYDASGNFQRAEPIRGSFFQFIRLTNGEFSLATLKGLYKGIRGQALTGSGNMESVVEELLGGGTWARVYHQAGKDGVIREAIDTRRFRSRDYGPPATITVRSDD